MHITESLRQKDVPLPADGGDLLDESTGWFLFTHDRHSSPGHIDQTEEVDILE